eukprot:CAMPEP_0114614204 /NCGR_PEP_ID=MMETSP0168-20121206/5528_1 /TAXON_ID=95228 ORGANISM="Vannella sp., Strain DIVA3 517/6/12" /NCGR_SAMPLE_ID=MMETSP0168 /ASSEMBLY_ACC=CAM_ASM_000044 /LENGTH=113 /DNA_ID=CAMNT_0001825235 /DNA_START=88 /DNA_END=429 /DNA_ORIENTATION=-
MLNAPPTVPQDSEDSGQTILAAIQAAIAGNKPITITSNSDFTSSQSATASASVSKTEFGVSVELGDLGAKLGGGGSDGNANRNESHVVKYEKSTKYRLEATQTTVTHTKTTQQ